MTGAAPVSPSRHAITREDTVMTAHTLPTVPLPTVPPPARGSRPVAPVLILLAGLVGTVTLIVTVVMAATPSAEDGAAQRQDAALGSWLAALPECVTEDSSAPGGGPCLFTGNGVGGPIVNVQRPADVDVTSIPVDLISTPEPAGGS